MRSGFFNLLFDEMEQDDKIFLLFADMGMGIYEKFRQRFGDRCQNVGIAEQNMAGIAAGLCNTGYRPFCYTISNFIVQRCFEQIRNDICIPNLPVTIIGSSTGFDNGKAGPTHHPIDDIGLIKTLPEIKIYSPSTINGIAACFSDIMSEPLPSYIRIGKGGTAFSAVDKKGGCNFFIHESTTGNLIITHGNTLDYIMPAIEKTNAFSLMCMNKVKPLDEELLKSLFGKYDNIIVLEEQFSCCGLYNMLCQYVVENNMRSVNLGHLGPPHEFSKTIGDSAFFAERYGYSAENIALLFSKSRFPMNQKFKVSYQQDIKRRKPLQDIVPLDTPLSMQLELSSVCNFKCGYCLHGSKRLGNSGFKSGIMSYETFVKAVDSISEFPRKLEFISLQSRGESFLNRRLPDMIRYLKAASVTKEISINTNATLLTPELSREIVDAGLDNIRISIQGVDESQYLKVCEAQVDFDKIVENLAYLYSIKNNLYIYIKIIDVDLSKEDKDKFLATFTDICDSLYIEKPVDSWVGADLKLDFSSYRYGYTPKIVNVCPRLFFAMVVHYDGTVVACDTDWEEIYPLGNVSTDRLVDIWNCERFNMLRKQHLSLKGRERAICDSCHILNHNELDGIDKYAEDMLKRLK